MPDSLMYDEEMFVVLETNQPEQFVTATELLEKLKLLLAKQQHHLPRDLENISTIEAQAKRLLDTTCELDVGSGQFFQWYAVRLDK